MSLVADDHAWDADDRKMGPVRAVLKTLDGRMTLMQLKVAPARLSYRYQNRTIEFEYVSVDAHGRVVYMPVHD